MLDVGVDNVPVLKVIGKCVATYRTTKRTIKDTIYIYF